MSAEQLYLLCFLVGFLFSLLSVLAQGLHVHLPGKHLTLPHHTAAHPTGGHGGSHGGGGGHAPHQQESGSVLNAGTIMAFLTWFGGTGYLLTHYGGFWGYLAFTLACAAGLAGATVIFWFTAKFLYRQERPLDAADYHMVGVTGKVNSSIRTGGTGELTFSQEGTRRVCGARSEDGTAIPRGTEVVVLRYEQGLAYVRRLDQFWAEQAQPGQIARE